MTETNSTDEVTALLKGSERINVMRKEISMLAGLIYKTVQDQMPARDTVEWMRAGGSYVPARDSSEWTRAGGCDVEPTDAAKDALIFSRRETVGELESRCGLWTILVCEGLKHRNRPWLDFSYARKGEDGRNFKYLLGDDSKLPLEYVQGLRESMPMLLALIKKHFPKVNASWAPLIAAASAA
jgi:hypothetical protein